MSALTEKNPPRMRGALIATGIIINVTAVVFTWQGIGFGLPFSVRKGIASTGFVLVGLGAGRFKNRYSWAMFAALVFCWLGDVGLALRTPHAFLIGLLAFLCGHLAFSTAFWLRGINWKWIAWATLATAPSAVLILLWLTHACEPAMIGPVVAYVCAISVMVTLSAGAWGNGASFLLPLGAVGFYISDIFVAVDHFTDINPSSYGYPLYHAAMLLLALQSGGPED